MGLKPEPLKGIEEQCHDFLNCKEGCEMPGYPKEKFTGFYIEKENVRELIKSAVEWFKGKMAGSLDNKSYMIFHKGINKAFEGVIKQED